LPLARAFDKVPLSAGAPADRHSITPAHIRTPEAREGCWGASRVSGAKSRLQHALRDYGRTLIGRSVVNGLVRRSGGDVRSGPPQDSRPRRAGNRRHPNISASRDCYGNLVPDARRSSIVRLAPALPSAQDLPRHRCAPDAHQMRKVQYTGITRLGRTPRSLRTARSRP
jgi:hypothetical protein